MRADAIGMFWEELPEKTKRNANGPRAMPPIPDTGWLPPTYLPDLSAARIISIDCETWDPELTDYKDNEGNEVKGKGPGWARGSGHIVGVSIGADGGGRWYFPLRHSIEPEWNWDPELVFAWLREQLGRKHQPKVGANIIYDVGWLRQEGVDVKGELYDVQYAEALLAESALVNLETLGQKYLREGKDSSELYEWLSRAYGGPANSSQRKNIHRCPPRLVGKYAESDADLPLRILPLQWAAMAADGLLRVFNMECKLIPLLIAMRFAGVTVDIKKAEALEGLLNQRADEANARLNDLAGFEVNVDGKDTLTKLFDKLGVGYPRTAATAKNPEGQASFRKDWLEQLDHPVGQMIREVRKLRKLSGTFVRSYILNAHRNGKVHGQFHALRDDGNGARSGRYSGSTPNLQNLPSRDEALAPLVRALFVPDAGHKQWRRYDYSQIEYRFLIHYATGPGADDIRAFFNAHPETDYHERTLDMVAPVAGWDISTKELRKFRRKPLKTINFGLIYGMGKDKLSRSLGISEREGKALFKAYHKSVPFAQPTMDACAEEAQTTGVIRTYLNRASRFDLWEPADFNKRRGVALPYGAATAEWGYAVERAYTHKALNRRLQGSAADLMKSAMLQCWEEGVFDYTGVPRLTVHDELDFSDPGDRDDGFEYMHRVMESALKLSIPVKADMEVGPDWGNCH